MESTNDVRKEPLSLANLAKEAEVPVSTAHKYVKLHADEFHYIHGPRGKLYPHSDVEILKAIYAKRIRRKSSADEQPTRPTTAEPGIAANETSLANPSDSVESTAEDIDTGLDVASIEQRLKDIHGQLDYLHSVVVHVWESQQQLVEALSVNNERIQQQDTLINMLTEYNSKLESDNARLRQVESLYQEVAVSGQSNQEDESTEEITLHRSRTRRPSFVQRMLGKH